jgi:hypothetical protein
MLDYIRERELTTEWLAYDSKELSVLKNATKEDQEMVTLKSLSDLTGFPIKMIKDELFANSDLGDDKLSLDDLRKAMLNYLDQTMLDDSESKK